MADASFGGEIYYFCHIHSKMSGRILIQNADGSAVTKADGSPLLNPTPLKLYAPTSRGAFDARCGTFDTGAYAPGSASACAESFLQGSLDTDFETCLLAIDCRMNREMRVKGYDTHGDAIATFVQQMIPHHINAVNMAKLVLKHAPAQVSSVEDFEVTLWDIINVQNYQVHQFRNYLSSHLGYGAVTHEGENLTATSLGHHCNSTLDTDVTISAASTVASVTGAVADCATSDTHLCVKVNLLVGETGYFEFSGLTGPSPDITVQIGKTYTFDQRDSSNWYHPLGFAFYPDGAHGDDWGGPERAEVEAAGQLLYKIDGAATTCPDAGDTGLDCYEPMFFYPRAEWMSKKYTAELTITQEMADASFGGEIYYFCHIHSKMSGRIIIQNADGSAVTKADGSPMPNPTPMRLYSPAVGSGVDATCGTFDVEPFSGGGASACSERFLCGSLDSDFEKCMQAISCKMHVEMKSKTSPDFADMVAVFMQQMIPHHANAVNMAKIVFKQVPAAKISAALDEDGMTNILMGIVNNQNYQIHQFRNYLAGLPAEEDSENRTNGSVVVSAVSEVASAVTVHLSQRLWFAISLVVAGRFASIVCMSEPL